MSTDPFDQKLRALVAAAVADTPPAKPLPAESGAGAGRGAGGGVTPFGGRRRPRLMWAGIGVAAAAATVAIVVLADRDDDRRITAASTTIASTTASTTAPTTETSSPSSSLPVPNWPAELAVVIASDRGIERVTSEGGQAVVTRLDAPLAGAVAFELPDGALVSRDGLLDVGLTGEVLVVSRGNESDPTSPTSVVLAVSPDGSERVLSVGDRMTHGLDIYVGQVTDADGTWTPLLITPTGELDTEFWQQLGVAGPHDPSAGDPPRLFGVAPSGSTIGWVEGDMFVLADGRTFPIPDGSKVVEADLTDDFVALTRGDGPGTIIDLRTAAAYPAPAAGRLTISLRPATDVPSSTTTTVDGGTPSGAITDVITAGADGVWRVTDGVRTQLTAEPMVFAVAGPDGSVIMQRKSGVGDWPVSETAPLVWADGVVQESGSGDIGVWWRIHDVAIVDGHWTMLYEVQGPQDQGVDGRPGELHAVRMDTGSDSLVAAQFGGWEAGSSRLHLAETGVVVGATYSEAVHALGAYALAGGDAGITSAALGLDDYYYDCVDCPHLFTISRDGSTIAWLDGTELVRWDVAAGAELDRTDLGQAVDGAVNLELGDGYVVVDRWNDQAVDIAPAIVQWSAAGTTVVELPGTAAAVVAPPA
ncbi:MAG: hypothetical protein Q7V88_17485 [Actinomycetota bacterium]|nr:hypothetical protein [Actinomycetota bacterium]